MYNKVIAHTCFMGHTGYANHARRFFTQLNELIPVSVISSTYDPSTEMSVKQLEMLEKCGEVDNSLHIVLETSNNPVFYEDIKGPKIAYNVWESTKQPDEFFRRLLDYDQLWVPSEWQRQCSINQGYPEDRVKVVREGVDGSVFKPDLERTGKFKFLVVGRWEYRKSTSEILQALIDEFPTEDVVFQCLVDNPFAVDGYSSTNERLRKNGFTDPRIKSLGFVSQEEYVRLLSTCDTFVSCSRSEGWNLPLLEAISCGVPVICSDCSGQKEYLDTTIGAMKVRVLGETEPRFTYPEGSVFPGMWYEPDFSQLREKLRYAYEYARHPLNINLRNAALTDSLSVMKEFTWENAATQGMAEISALHSGVKTVGKISGNSTFYTSPGNVLKDLSQDTGEHGYTYKEVFKDLTYCKGKCTPKNSAVVVDCGANIGTFSRWALLNGCGRVYSIEAERGNFAALKKNILTGNVFNYAVGGTLEEVELYTHTSRGGHSVIDNNINNTQTGDKQIVRGITLDSFIEQENITHIDFLKMDIEGAELEAFNGLSDENLSKINKIALEYHNMIYDFDLSLMEGLVEKLRENGFVVSIVPLGDNKHLYMIYAYRGEESVEEYVVHFVDGPFCEIKGEGDEEYIVSFTDLTTGEISYRNKIKPNHWVRPNKKYFTKWLVEVFRVFDRERVLKHEFDPSGRRVAIWLGSKSLGDTLAWMPYLEEFRKKHNCEVFTATWWNELLAPVYPEITFMKVGESVPDLYASYTMGVYDGDTNKHREDWRSVPLQKVASDILGISYKEVRSKIADLGGSVDVDGDGDYICIAEFSTARCKLWNRLNGWQDVVDRLTEAGERVVSISKEPTGLGSNVLRLNDRKMKDTIATLKNAKLFIGVSSGLAWVAWALGVPVVLISGFTEEFNEFTSGVARVMDKSVCHGCFNDKEYSFDRGNWNWCPRDKDFECTRVITPEMVMLAIESLKKE